MFSLPALAKEIGCNERQVRRWCNAGLPFTSVKGSHGGKPALRFEREGALLWIREHGSGKWSLEAGRLLAKGGGRKKKAGGKTSPVPGPEEKTGGGSSPLAKLEEAFEASSERFAEWNRQEARMMAEGRLREAKLCAQARAEAGKAVAQMQEQVMAAEKEIGTLVEAEEMEGRYLKVLNTVKNNVMGIPESVIPLLMPFLRDPEDAARVKDLMAGKVEDALRHIANSAVDD